jgi:hypothetical protein
MKSKTFLKAGGVLTVFTIGAILVGWLTADPKLAHAYTISSPITAGCHEEITTDALRAVRRDFPNEAPLLDADRNDRALIDDLEFTPASDMTDLGGATLLLGVRDNDLKGRDSMALSQLALVHGDPSAQREHCLRDSDQKEPDGSRLAVLKCQDFIRERIVQALEGLTDSKPDPTKRTSLSVYLSLRHRVDASLPTYYVRIGQAIHAIEDSFAHTYRTSNSMQITVVMNWVNEANGNLDEATDGPPHSSELDRCDDPTGLRHDRRKLATDAATEVLLATLDPNQSDVQKMATVEVILKKYLSYSPGSSLGYPEGCTLANDWCKAAERQYGNSQFGCSMGDLGRPTSGWGWAVMLGLFALVGRTFQRNGKKAVIGMAILGLTSLFPSRAFAQPEPGRPLPDPTAVAAEHKVPPPVTTPVKEPGPKDPSQVALGAYLGGAGSINNAAAAAALGARLRFSKHWTFGLDAEWNPWIAVNGASTVRAGAFNGYGTVILRLPLAYEQFNLRTTANLGVSRLLIDLYGAPKGSTGIYAGLSPLGLEWKISRMFFLIINPLNFAMPTPQLKGVPFSYSQYRFTIGLEVYGG